MNTRHEYAPTTNIEQIVKNKAGTVTAYLFMLGEKPALKVFIGKRSRPEIFQTYSTSELRNDYAAKWIKEYSERFTNWENIKAERRKDRFEGAKAFEKEVKVGDLFCCTFSYNMTINTFYQVVQKSGKNLVVIQCDSDRSGSDGWSGVEYARAVSPDFAGGFFNRKHYTAKISGSKRITIEGNKKAYLTTETERHYFNTLD